MVSQSGFYHFHLLKDLSTDAMPIGKEKNIHHFKHVSLKSTGRESIK